MHGVVCEPISHSLTLLIYLGGLPTGGVPNLVGLVEYTPLGWSASSIDMLRMRKAALPGSLSTDEVLDTLGMGTPPTINKTKLGLT